MLGMSWQPRVKDSLNLWMVLEKLCDCKCIALMLTHPDNKSFDTAKHQPAIERLGTGTKAVDKKLKPGVQILTVRQYCSANNIGVTIEVFGSGMNHNVSPKFKWLLTIRREEGIVNDGQKSPLFCES